jgi:rubrerythrin
MEMFEADTEIFEFAIAREIEAYEFYCALAERMMDPEKQQIFTELAAEELQHKEKLELEVMKLGHVVKLINTDDLDEVEYEIRGDYEFDLEYKDLLQLAIEKEQAAFQMYASMSSKVHDQASTELLLTLAEEEVKHKLRFEFEYENLLKKEQD